MTLRESPALLEALALLDNPRGPRPGARQPLPAEILGLVRIAAGDQERIEAAVRATGLTAETLREAVVFYIQQVLFAPTSDCYRVLGVGPRDPDELIREHHRWLLRWLHPDRNADQWEVIYAERVNRAWQELRTAERRQRYDGEAAALLPSGPAVQPATPANSARAAPALFVEPISDFRAKVPGLRWLPSLVFGTLGISAILAVGLLYAMRSLDARQAPRALAEVEPALPARPSVVAIAPPTAEATPPGPTPRSAAKLAPAPTPRPARLPASQSMAMPASGHPDLLPPPAALRPVAPAGPAIGRAVPFPAAQIAVRRVSVVADPPPAEAVAIRARPSTMPTPLTPVVDPGRASARSTSAPPAPRPQIDDRIAYGLLNVFSDIYRQGDLARLRDFLTEDAQSARGGRDSLVSEYGALFASSDRRRLTVSNVSWLDNGQTASIIASFEASVDPRNGGWRRRSRGDLRLDVRMDKGKWRIYRLTHDEHRG